MRVCAPRRDWVRDVAWAPSIGLPYSTIASCSQDGTVAIWTQDEDGGPWKAKVRMDALAAGDCAGA